ncbi:MAG: FadR family transcriptional regulator [Planctomycetota bacterium]|nr:MAG: FadR family transcriptional regulator [Planctomycetota bacterium]
MSPAATTTRKADRVADDLLRRIVSGELAVGSLLPRENALAERYGVNRGVVREAVKLLEVHRLVRPRRRRGTEVLDPMESLSPEVLAAMLEPAPGRVDPEVFADLLELRAELDEAMVRLAAERRSEEDLVALDEALADVRAAEAADDAEATSRAMNRMALAIARASQNRLYPMLVHWHRRIVASLFDLFREVRRPSPQHTQGVELLVALIRQRDVEGAAALVRAFHAFATPRLLDAVREAQEESP